jgi:hypothetical protein
MLQTMSSPRQQVPAAAGAQQQLQQQQQQAAARPAAVAGATACRVALLMLVSGSGLKTSCHAR